MIGLVLVCAVLVDADLDSGYDYHRTYPIFFEEEPQVENMYGQLGMSDEDKVPMAPLDDFDVMEATTPVIEDDNNDNATSSKGLPQVYYGDDSADNPMISKLRFSEDDSFTENPQKQTISGLPDSESIPQEAAIPLKLENAFENEQTHYDIENGPKILPLTGDYIIDDLDASRALEDDLITKDDEFYNEEVPGHVLTDLGYVYHDPRSRY